MSSPSDFVIENGVLTKYNGPGGDVIIPDGVKEIRQFGFAYCNTLTHVVIPNGVMKIGYNAFGSCENLLGVTFPNSVTHIDQYAFSGCKSLAQVTLPDSVTIIGGYAFLGCESLTSITIPESVTQIGNNVFRYCSRLTSISIPDSVTAIGDNLVEKKVRIQINDISLLPSPLRPNAALGFAYSGGDKQTPGFDAHSKYIKTNASKLVDLAIAEPVLLTLMCREKLITPKNIELYVAEAQKSGNAELIAMMLDYQKNQTGTRQKESIEKRKEKEQDKITERMIARREKEGIKDICFAVTGKLELFANRDSLKSVIEQRGGRLASSLTAKVDYLIMNNPDSDSAKAEKAKELGIEIIPERRFLDLAGMAFKMEGTKVTKYRGQGGDIVIPTGAASIGDRAFPFHIELTGVTIPDSVTQIGEFAFWGCKNLTNVTIPLSVSSIGEGAFLNCSNLTIHAPAGSYAEQYAKENSIRFVAE